jgi:hypothetical protein
VFHHGKIVGHEKVREAELILKVLKKVEDLGLDGDVQGGDGLVAHHELRVEGQRPGDPNPLALAAGKLVGIAPHVLGLQAHCLEKLRHPFPQGFPFGQAVHDQGLTDDVAHGHPGVQGGIGILENDLHFPPQKFHRFLVGFNHVHLFAELLGAEPNFSRGGFNQAKDGAGAGGLSAAGFAHKPQGFAHPDEKVHLVHGLDPAHDAAENPAAHGEILLQPVHAEQNDFALYGHGFTP